MTIHYFFIFSIVASNKIISRIFNPTTEKIIFCFFLVFSLYTVWRTAYFVTLDGPAHLYNASLLNRIDSSSFLGNYFEWNTFLLPNHLSHWILAKLLLWFEACTAEKILLSFIIVFLPLSFRYAIKTLTKTTPYFSFLIFLLVFTSLLYHGFYNFTMGFIFFNCHVILSSKLKGAKSKYAIFLLLFLNSFLLYYCHAFGYGLAVLFNAIYLGIVNRKDARNALKTLSLFIALHIPTMIFLGIFMVTTSVTFFDYDLEPYEKWRALMDFSPGIVFEVKRELHYSVIVSFLFIVLFSYAVIKRLQLEKKLRETDLYLIFSMLVIYLIFHTTDGAFGGMFVQRLLYLTFYFLVIWLCCNLIKNEVLILIVLLISLYSFINATIERNKTINGAQKEIVALEMAEKFIEDKSTVQVIILTDIWFQQHLSNYLGLQKEVVLSENYEASLAWFPLKWKKEIMQEENYQVNRIKNPDYILVYGNKTNLHIDLKDTLRTFTNKSLYKLYESSDGYCKLFSTKSPN